MHAVGDIWSYKSLISFQYCVINQKLGHGYMDERKVGNIPSTHKEIFERLNEQKRLPGFLTSVLCFSLALSYSTTL